MYSYEPPRAIVHGYIVDSHSHNLSLVPNTSSVARINAVALAERRTPR